ncbi:MAG: beta-ketoacyl synthase [Candidatus Binatia bacterium]
MTARVAIVGSGAICGLGREPDAIWEAVRRGESAIARIRQWDSRAWVHGHAAEVDGCDAAELVGDRKLLKLLRRTHVFGFYAGMRALEQAGFVKERVPLWPAAIADYNDRSGIYVGVSGSAYQDQYEFLPLMARSDGEIGLFGAELARAVSPMWLLQTLPNNVLCHLGIRTGFSGPHACVVAHSTAGVLAVAEALDALRTGEVDRALAVAHVAPIEPQALQGYATLGLLGRDVVRPFDARGDGCLFGEGAAALALEPVDRAAARGASSLGEVLGSGAVSEGGALFAVDPGGEGLARAIELALADARCAPGDVGVIVAHGNGTRTSDRSEAAALQRVFGAAIPPVTAFKWATGHLFPAAALLDVILALAALRTGEVPGIATLREVDPACAPLPLSADPQRPRGELALVLSRGFAGANAALVVRAAR